MIHLRALGVLDLRTGDNQEIRQVLAQPKRAALLTYLVLAARFGSHPREQLLALFWPDHPPDQARNALSQAVHFLRRALGDDVIVSQNGDPLGVAPSSIHCDVIAFDEAIRQGKLHDALELYRGEFLEGFHVANAPEFERWLDAERRRLTERVALEALATERQDDWPYGVRTHRRDGWEHWYRTVDARLAKAIPTGRGRASVIADIFNVFNTANHAEYQPNASQPGYGEPTGDFARRQGQIGLRYWF